MRPIGSPTDLEARRRRAVGLLNEGLGVCEVARQIGCSPTSVSRWQADVLTREPDALRPKPTPGRPPRITPRQWAKVLQSLLKGAKAHGFSTDLWTLPRVAEVIARTCGVRYHPAHVWKILREKGWSCQKPERRAKERDEAAIYRWRTERWPQKNARRAGRSLVFLDESGFMLQPVCRRPWAPRGQTPILRQWDRRDRLSALSALTVAPRRSPPLPPAPASASAARLHAHLGSTPPVPGDLRHCLAGGVPADRRRVAARLCARSQPRRARLEPHQIRGPRELHPKRSPDARKRCPQLSHRHPGGADSARGAHPSGGVGVVNVPSLGQCSIVEAVSLP